MEGTSADEMDGVSPGPEAESPGLEAEVETVVRSMPSPVSATEPPVERRVHELELDTDGQVRSHRPHGGSKLLTRGLPVGLLLGVSVWSLMELSGLDKPVREPKKVETGEAPVTAAPIRSKITGPGEAVEEVAAPEEAEPPPLGKKLGRLFERVDVVRVRPPETTEAVLLSQAVNADGITVINLWATWCKPCKRELPGLKQMFAGGEPRWGDKVRFVPIRVDDNTDEVWSYTKFVDTMPPTEHFLIDAGVGGGIRGPLEAAGLIKEKAGLPITLVLDCKQSVRWHHTGELKAPVLAELAAAIDEMHAARGTYCRRPKPPKQGAGAVTERGADEPETSAVEPVSDGAAPAAPTCGDGTCGRREDCKSCVKDCSCGNGEACKRTSEGGFFCKELLE